TALVNFPLNSVGAAGHADRFRRPGGNALYCTLSNEAALREYQQDPKYPPHMPAACGFLFMGGLGVRRTMRDILHQILDTTPEVGAKPVKVVGADTCSVLVEHLGEGVSGDPRGFGNLLDGHAATLPEFFFGRQFLELVSK